ncbi:MAG TPA: copper transporter [Actinomycetota bacterium]|nr:copper transporter [Actinomycetota bacterium]
MISFRFHLVSLVAVFLALGLGVLSGTTVINRGIVTRLEEQTADLEKGNASLRARVDELEADLEVWTDFGEQVAGYLVADELAGRELLVLTQEGTDDAAVTAVQRTLEDAGARILTLLSVSNRMSLPTEADRLDLAQAIGEDPEQDPELLKADAARELAEDLSSASPGPEVLPELLASEFVLNLGPQLSASDVRNLGEADAIVVVGGGTEPAAPQPERFLVPFVAAASTDGTPVAAAETLESAYEFVTLLRSDGTVAEQIVTQDNVSQVPGEIGLVLALDDLLTTGESGHFGVKSGASGVIPPPER